MIRHIAASLALCAALFSFSPAHADPDGATILAAVDKRAEFFEDQAYTASMEIWRGGTLSKTMIFEMTLKGLEKQYIEFKSPGDVAGMKIVMTDPDELWMYTPEFKKVRKIAAHAQNQGFLGSEFTPEDMASTKLSVRYEAKLGGRSGTETTLELAPKAGVESTYPKLEVVIDAKQGGVTIIRYFNAKGAVVREQRREGWTKVDDKPFPSRISMKNLESGNETVILLSDIRVNQGVPDDLFSRRTLLRG